MNPQDDLLEIEEGAVQDVAGQWKSDVVDFKKSVVLILTSAAANGEDEATTLAKIKALLAKMSVPTGMDDIAVAAVKGAHKLALALVKSVLKVKTLPKIPVSKNSVKAVTGLDAKAEDAVKQSISNLNRATKTTQTEILTAVAPVLQSPAKTEAAVAWATNNAFNSAVAKEAKELGERVCWISERDSCVHCQAYNGEFSDGGDFPAKTFAAKPLKTLGRTYHPPLHPRCRCQIEIGISDDYAAALKREAVRSILKGFKMESESEKVRVDAAKRLLEKDPVAPASVKKYSERMVKKFETKKPVAKVTAKSIEGKDYRNMTNAEKLKAAEVMYGKNSKQYQEALKRFGKK